MSSCSTITVNDDDKMSIISITESEVDEKMSSSSTITVDTLQFRSANEPAEGPNETKQNVVDDTCIDNAQKNIIDGNRIVDLDYLIKSLFNLAYGEEDRHKESCNRKKWEMQKSNQKGFKTFVTLICIGCGATVVQKSHPNDANKIDVNMAMVFGSMAAGSGYSNMQELLAPAGIPCISSTAYLEHQKNITRLIIKTAEEIMKKNGQEEREALIKKGLFITVKGPNGEDIIVPLGTVHSDASWMQRSFADGSHGSLGGAVTVMGSETNKPLDLKAKCKGCAMCDRGGQDKEHDCYKNFSRAEASSSMEAKGIVEAFNDSWDKHRIVYKNFVGDGDSSAISAVLKANPYAKFGIKVKKLFCTNHALKNHTKQSRRVSPKLQSVKGKFAIKARKIICKKRGHRIVKTKPSVIISNRKTLRKRMAKARTILSENVQRFRKEIKAAAKRRREDSKLSYPQKIDLLKKDIMNVPYHVFGSHKECSSLGGWPCMDQLNGVKEKSENVEMMAVDTKDANSEKEHVISLLEEFDILPQLLRLHGRLLLIIDSLLLDTTTNLVESIHGVMCKHNAGKRLSLSLTGNYSARCHCAIIGWSTKHLQATIIEKAGKTIPNSVLTMEDKREEKVQRNKQYCSKKRRDKKTNKCNDKNYGPVAEKPDMDEEMFEIQKEIFLKTLKTYQQNRVAIAERTIDQSLNDEWQEFHQKLITSVNFGEICKRREITLCSTLVKKILFSSGQYPSSAQYYGLYNEENARNELSKMIGQPVERTGMWIDPDLEYLAASPDGLINANLKDLHVFSSKGDKKKHIFTYSTEIGGVVEIKCPERGEDLTPNELLKTYPDLKNIFDKKLKRQLNKRHSFYYQMQGQIHVTRKTWGLFVLWTPLGKKVSLVWRDDVFWKKMVEPQLTRFYYHCMLPEIVDSRVSRSMIIREPEYILEKRATKNTHISQLPVKEAEESKKDVNDLSQSNEMPSKKRKTKQTDSAMNSTQKKKKKDIMLAFAPKDMAPCLNVVNNKTAWLDDEALDALLEVLRTHSNFETLSVLNIVRNSYVPECTRNLDVQIVGGNCIDHWRMYHFKDGRLTIFESFYKNLKYKDLSPDEHIYIKKRYPLVNPEDVSFVLVQEQPDGSSCGLYAAARATSVALGKDPFTDKYSNDPMAMRRHFNDIIISKKLTPFPRP